jgi:hypothetical protein
VLHGPIDLDRVYGLLENMGVRIRHGKSQRYRRSWVGTSLKLGEGRFQRRSDLLCRIIQGEAVILNGEAGVLHRLNSTASFIWECCDGTSSVDDIVARLANAYDIDSRTCQKDVSEIVLKLESLNLLTRKITTSGEGPHV